MFLEFRNYGEISIGGGGGGGGGGAREREATLNQRETETERQKDRLTLYLMSRKGMGSSGTPWSGQEVNSNRRTVWPYCSRL